MILKSAEKSRVFSENDVGFRKVWAAFRSLLLAEMHLVKFAKID